MSEEKEIDKKLIEMFIAGLELPKADNSLDKLKLKEVLIKRIDKLESLRELLK